MRLFTVLIISGVLTACGVKGKPLPPLEPAPIGNGKPLQDKDSTKTTTTDGSSKNEKKTDERKQ